MFMRSLQYQCAPVLMDQIHSVSEPSTCSYVIVIDSPRLCKDAAFQRAEAPEANKIDCRPLVTDELYYKMASEPGTIDSSANGKDKVVSQDEVNKPDEMTLLQELVSVMNDPELDKDEYAELVAILLQKYQKALEPLMSEAQKAILKKFQGAFDKNAEIKLVGLGRNGQADHGTVVYLKADSAKAASSVKEQDGENKGGDEEEKTFLDMVMDAIAEEITPEQEESAAKFLNTLLADLDIDSLPKPKEAEDDANEEDNRKNK